MKYLLLFWIYVFAVTGVIVFASDDASAIKAKINGANVAEIEKLLPSLDKESLRYAQLRLAHMYRHQCLIDNNKMLYGKAMALYRTVMSQKGDSSLAFLNAGIEMADMAVNFGDFESVEPILKEVTDTKIDDVYDSTFDEDFYKQVNRLGPHELVDIGSKTHKEAVDARITSEKKIVLEQFQECKREAVSIWCLGLYHKNGIQGLRQLFEKYKEDKVVAVQIREIIAGRITNNGE